MWRMQRSAPQLVWIFPLTNIVSRDFRHYKYNFKGDFSSDIYEEFSLDRFLHVFHSTYSVHSASMVFPAFSYNRFV